MEQDLKDELVIWQLVTKKICSLQEIEYYWSLDDVLRANATIEFNNELQKELSREKKNGRVNR